MNHLVYDFAKRLKWFFLLQFVVTTIFWALPREMMQKLHFENFGPAIIFFDMMRGSIRTCSALPISRRALARGIWMSAVILPTIVGSLAIVVGSCLHGTFSIAEWVRHTLIGGGMGGTVMFLLTCLPTTPSTTAAGKLRDTVVGMLWGFSMMFSMAYVFLGNTLFHAASSGLTTIMYVIMAVLTLLSYATAQRMVIARATRIVLSTPSTSRSVPAPETAVGWNVWVKMELRGQFLIFTMVLLGGLITRMLTDKLGLPPNPEMQFGQLAIFFFMATFFSFIFGHGALRAMRAMPISGDTVARLFLFRSLASVLNIWLVSQLITLVCGSNSPFNPHAMLTAIFLGGILSILQALAFRYPHPWIVFAGCLCLGPMILLYGKAQTLSAQAGIHTTWIILIIIATYATSWALQRRWIRTSHKIYRRLAWMARFSPAPSR